MTQPGPVAIVVEKVPNPVVENNMVTTMQPYNSRHGVPCSPLASRRSGKALLHTHRLPAGNLSEQGKSELDNVVSSVYEGVGPNTVAAPSTAKA